MSRIGENWATNGRLNLLVYIMDLGLTLVQIPERIRGTKCDVAGLRRSEIIKLIGPSKLMSTNFFTVASTSCGANIRLSQDCLLFASFEQHSRGVMGCMTFYG
jgi:hypothetical protein